MSEPLRRQAVRGVIEVVQHLRLISANDPPLRVIEEFMPREGDAAPEMVNAGNSVDLAVKDRRRAGRSGLGDPLEDHPALASAPAGQLAGDVKLQRLAGRDVLLESGGGREVPGRVRRRPAPGAER